MRRLKHQNTALPARHSSYLASSYGSVSVSGWREAWDCHPTPPGPATFCQVPSPATAHSYVSAATATVWISRSYLSQRYQHPVPGSSSQLPALCLSSCSASCNSSCDVCKHQVDKAAAADWCDRGSNEHWLLFPAIRSVLLQVTF